jgi:predicted regulator of Ras-like GTPase activity (Roadblock/LC7/MglB family)
MFASQARLLQDCLISLTTRVRDIRGLLLVDKNGLPLVSTLGSRNLEEALAAFAAGIMTQLARAEKDFEMGPSRFLHIQGRDRQILLVPVTNEAALAAIVEASATPSTIALHLLGMCTEILVVLHLADEGEGRTRP